MANVNLKKILLQILKETLLPAASPKYPETWLLRETIKIIDKEILKTNTESQKSVPRWRKYAINRTYKKLLTDNLVKLDDNGHPYLTKNGENLLAKFKLNDYIIKKPKKWDKKYRVIIFDIPVFKNKERILFRKQLFLWGFIQLQHSVWVYPYECREAISLLKSSFNIVPDVVCMIVETIENDGWLKKEFDLN